MTWGRRQACTALVGVDVAFETDGESADSGDGTSADGTASAGENGPGFGPVVAVLAVLGVALLAARRG